jgi:hypothetical protein
MFMEHLLWTTSVFMLLNRSEVYIQLTGQYLGDRTYLPINTGKITENIKKHTHKHLRTTKENLILVIDVKFVSC